MSGDWANFLRHKSIFLLVFLFLSYICSGKKVYEMGGDFFPPALTVVKPAAKISLRFTVLKHPTDNYRIYCNFFFIVSIGELPKPVFQQDRYILERCCPLLFSLHTDDVEFGFLSFFYFFK